MPRMFHPAALAASLLAAAAVQAVTPATALAADDSLRAAVALAQRVGALQAAGLGGDTVVATVAAATRTAPAVAPSSAVLALAARHGVEPTDAQRRAALDLDLLPQPARDALAGVVTAYAAFDDAALTADAAAVYGARARLLDSVVALRDAAPAARQSDQSQAAVLNLCPAVALDLQGTSDTYTANCALTVDVGGDDTYLNNAGGSNVLGVPQASCGGFQVTGAGALVDLAGRDRYVSGLACGINGGGSNGAGFLLDAAGDDVYEAAIGGVNGGGSGRGHGFLLDVAGHDAYRAGNYAANGGAGWSGVGALIDTGGNDSYEASSWGTNGGAHERGHGLLIDTTGTDSYTAHANGANGSADPATFGTGLLLDGGGTGDKYVDYDGGTGTDKTVVPKGPVGAQLDLMPTFAATPAWVDRTLLSQTVPVTTPGVAAINADLVRVKGGRSTTDPRNYDLSVWAAGDPAPTNPVSVFTGGLVATPIDVSLLTTPAIASQAAEVRVSARHRYDASQVVCLLGVGGQCVNAPLNPLDVAWLATAGQGATLTVKAELLVNGAPVASQTVPVPLVGQLLATVA